MDIVEWRQQIVGAEDRKDSRLLEGPTQREQLLHTAFKRTNNDMLHSNFDTSYSGTTACTVLIAGDILLCANVGDSRAILASVPNAAPGLSGEFIVTELSRDHKPNTPGELERILMANGRVEPARGTKYSFLHLDAQGQFSGPSRVWKKALPLPGLAISRSLGDRVAHEVGVISTPEIREVCLRDVDRAVVLASDGVWEVLANEYVIKLVLPYWKYADAEAACEAVVKEASAAWQNLNCTRAVDITVFVVFLA
jgi:serine/threonine protein phosphatase PrpC